jgi:hypothetical protein
MAIVCALKTMYHPTGQHHVCINHIHTHWVDWILTRRYICLICVLKHHCPNTYTNLIESILDHSATILYLLSSHCRWCCLRKSLEVTISSHLLHTSASTPYARSPVSNTTSISIRVSTGSRSTYSKTHLYTSVLYDDHKVSHLITLFNYVYYWVVGYLFWNILLYLSITCP